MKAYSDFTKSNQNSTNALQLLKEALQPKEERDLLLSWPP